MRFAESGRVENAARSPQHLPTVELPWRSSELDGASLEPVERHRLCGRYQPPDTLPLDEFERIVNDYPVFRVA